MHDKRGHAWTFDINAMIGTEPILSMLWRELKWRWVELVYR